MAGNDHQKDTKQRASLATSLAVYSAGGVQLAVATVAGLVFGDYIDKKIGTGPWLAVAGVMMGFAGGLVTLVRIMKRFGR